MANKACTLQLACRVSSDDQAAMTRRHRLGADALCGIAQMFGRRSADAKGAGLLPRTQALL